LGVTAVCIQSLQTAPVKQEPLSYRLAYDRRTTTTTTPEFVTSHTSNAECGSSAALDLTHVACGRLDEWENLSLLGISRIVLLEEAGNRAYDGSGPISVSQVGFWLPIVRFTLFLSQELLHVPSLEVSGGYGNIADVSVGDRILR